MRDDTTCMYMYKCTLYGVMEDAFTIKEVRRYTNTILVCVMIILLLNG